ncbi:MAG: NfeD family protein [Bacteroidales bacterium]
MDYIIVTAILLLSIILFLAEIFILPGITVAGISGVVIAAAGLAYAWIAFGLPGLITAIFAGVILFVILFYICLKSKMFDKLALRKNSSSTIRDKEIRIIHPGDEVITVSRLNPMGRIVKENEFFEAKSESGFIDEGQTMYVTGIQGNTVIVSSVKPKSL